MTKMSSTLLKNVDVISSPLERSVQVAYRIFTNRGLPVIREYVFFSSTFVLTSTAKGRKMRI